MALGRNGPLVEAPKGIAELPACVLLPSCPEREGTAEPSPHSDTWVSSTHCSCSGFVTRHCDNSQDKDRARLLPEKSKMLLRALGRKGRASLTQVQEKVPSLAHRGAGLIRGGLGILRELGHRLRLRTNNKKALAGHRKMRSR